MRRHAGSTQHGYGRVAASIACALTLAIAAPAHADAPRSYQRGFVLTGWDATSYLTPSSDEGLRRMADDGSNQAAVFTQWFMDDPTSSQIAPDPDWTPTDQAILHAMDVARSAGMSVTLKPQIAIRTGSWIGYAHPGDLDSFWADYRTMLLHYADLAQEGGATTLVVGTEMGTLSSDEARWRALIAEVRTHFSGQLTYAANYDEFQRVPFWDALDYIGIDAYFGLAHDDDPAPGADTLAAAWGEHGYLARIAAVSEYTRRKVLFTEIGYRGTHGTAAHPNIWNGNQVTDLAAQASAYEAFYRAVSQQPWMAGFYWWEVGVGSWWVQDYNPIGKDAERVLIDWNARLAAAPPEPPPAEAPADSPAAPDTTPPPATTAPAATTPPADAATPPPAPARPTTAAPAPHPTIYMIVRGRRVVGAVAPYAPACNGQVELRVRVRRSGRWRYVRSPAPLRLTSTGRFTHRMPGKPLRVKAVYSSRCAETSSAWITRSG